jgi:peptidoglycan/xylan/chitin deacetylase (PgdA/CDA1 family)
MRIAASAASAQPGDDLGRPWLRRPPRAPGDTPVLPAGSYEPHRFPPDFWGYDPLLPQPSWYPRHIHLTIDDGPRPQYLTPALDVLDRHGVKVTLFFVGAALVRRHLEDPEALRTILDRVIASGHGIGYHSMNHDTWPDIHESEREPDQFADSVTLYRWILRRLTGRAIPVVHGRFPGGRGAFLEAMPRLYAEAGLLQHVFWTFGPGYWVQHTPTGMVKAMACELARAPEPVTILLHEFPMMAMHFEGFLQTIRTQCPADATPTIPEIRTVWRKDDVFAPTLCSSKHDDLRRLCERPVETARRPGTNGQQRRVGQRAEPRPGQSNGSGGAQGQPLGPAR